MYMSGFFVPKQQPRVVATEAAMNAINNQLFFGQFEEMLRLKPQLLSKEDEGKMGVLGVASSVDALRGLVIDVGGGSLQLNWATKSADGQSHTGPTGSISLPFGAAALMAKLEASSEAPHHTTAGQRYLRKAPGCLDGPPASSRRRTYDSVPKRRRLQRVGTHSYVYGRHTAISDTNRQWLSRE